LKDLAHLLLTVYANKIQEECEVNTAFQDLTNFRPNFYSETIYEKSFAYGGPYTFFPLQSRPLEMKANRMEVYFSFNPPPEDNHKRWVKMDGLRYEKGSFLLRYFVNPRNESKGVFAFISLGEENFRHNGQVSFFSVLEQGDWIEMGSHRLKMGQKEMVGGEGHGEWLATHRSVICSNLNILLEGETGTGKGHLARQIHEESGRVGDFVQVNLSSFGASLIESEIFGHVKGSFTGALADKKGALESANYGTLFLDEIDSLPLDVQTKLLIYLDDQKFRRVGDSREVRTDTRFVFASGRPLSQQVSNGVMRRDFFYRIQSGLIHQLPSLRSRPRLIEEFCQSYADKEKLKIPKELVTYYSQQLWPGNYRQLKGHLDLKNVYYGKRPWLFDLHDMKLKSGGASDGLFASGERRSLKEVKKYYVQKVFYELGRDLKLTSEILKTAPQTVKANLQ
jgi:hypothetical protein